MDLQALYNQATTAHRQGDLAGAEQAYLRLLAAVPNNPQIRHPLGVLRAQQGRVDEALALLEGLLAEIPSDAGLLKDYALALAGAGRDQEALAVFDRALNLVPGDQELVRLRIDVLLRLGRHADVLAASDQPFASRPQDLILLHQRGRALAGLGRHAEAEACFARILERKPDSEAALYDRGTALAAQHRIAEWFASFHTFAQRAAPPPGGGSTLARHDAEQQAWQREQGISPRRGLHIEGGARLEGPAVNPVNAGDAARQWRENLPQVVVVDNLLTDEALAALRRFCLGSTVWRTGYDSGYLGAFPEHGFSAALLAQIAEEFREVFSAICRELPLKYAWAFKYDSSMEGVHIHADDAIVNVNFWITPDEANLDSESGGLLVWDVAAPRNWDFTKFGSEQAATRDFLAQNNAGAITVPYRANRAVIFDSQLLHQTNKVRFRPGYSNRRINVTLLYGERNAPG
ncbi:MAG: tetratricopeptide repeat protein [Alphaproteobacteria bacterium]|nr:tetratricopeptide repeat protein [Alphaproteobacteria bacterium]